MTLNRCICHRGKHERQSKRSGDVNIVPQLFGLGIVTPVYTESHLREGEGER